jgi:FtsK/SpoIIIE family
MRRQARQARRGGLQPMMVINSAEPFPETAGMMLLRWAWRYRSELAPLGVTVGLVCSAWWLHAERPHWWGLILGSASIATWAIAAFGARIGLATLIERVYASTTTLAAGAWLCSATALGAFTSPLPQFLLIGAPILSVPWWAHRRRRARVRVERKLEAWPEIAKAVGLAGSQIMSATVDLWGWRARLRLARGQTISDVVAKAPAIESGLGTFRGALRVLPTPDGLANRCELRALDSDPHADAITWPGPSVSTITQPIELGPFEDASPCRVMFLRRHAIFGGTTGSGKSGGLNVLLANLTACPDVIIWAIDLKKGIELGPWQQCIDRLATTPAEATALLRDAVAVMEARAAYLASIGRRVWEPTPQMPALVIIIDEYAELSEQAPDAMPYTDSIARLGRAVAETLVAATQRPTQKAMGQGAVRSQMDTRICFRVREQRDVDLILGQGMLSAGWAAHKLNAPGKFLVSAPEHDIPKRARAYLVNDDTVNATCAMHARIPRRLDSISRAAIETGPADIHDESSRQAVVSRTSDIGDAGGKEHQDPNSILSGALSSAPAEGIPVGELIRVTGMSRRWVFYRLRQLAAEGKAVQTVRGYWRAAR